MDYIKEITTLRIIIEKPEKNNQTGCITESAGMKYVWIENQN